MENKYSEEDLAIYATFYKVSSGNKTFSEWLNEFRFNLWKDSLTKNTVTDVTVTPVANRLYMWAHGNFDGIGIDHATEEAIKKFILGLEQKGVITSNKTTWIGDIPKDNFKVKESIAIKNDYSTIPNDMSYLISVGLFVQAFMNNKAEWSYKLYKLPEQCDIDFAKSGECMLPDEYLSPMRVIVPEISTESYNEAMYQGIKFAKEYINKSS